MRYNQHQRHTSQAERLNNAWPLANMMKDLGYHEAAYALIRGVNANYFNWEFIERRKEQWKQEWQRVMGQRASAKAKPELLPVVDVTPVLSTLEECRQELKAVTGITSFGVKK